MQRDWKLISQLVVDRHSEEGGSTLLSLPHFKIPPTEGDAYLLEFPESFESFDGEEITMRQVRKFLWDHRKSRKSTRPRSVVVTQISGGESKIGFGALTHKDVANSKLVKAN
jgi:hypothetical protein